MKTHNKLLTAIFLVTFSTFPHPWLEPFKKQPGETLWAACVFASSVACLKQATHLYSVRAIEKANNKPQHKQQRTTNDMYMCGVIGVFAMVTGCIAISDILNNKS